ISFAGIGVPGDNAGDAVEVYEGQRVRHRKFGDGTVEDIEGRGLDRMIVVRFDMAGKKRLMASYAKLQVIGED
ncbi:MAG: hypothetical protein JXB33_00610, partial [Clostridia bacterium]|nr:hypothetical protein [Clostridia bacterium]